MALPLKTNIITGAESAISSAKSSVSSAIGSKSTSLASANLTSSKISIPRQGWILYPVLDASDKIVFNVNPASIDYTFAGRRSNSKSRYGRVFTQGFSNALVNNMDIDVSFQMQSGNLLNPDTLGAPTEGSGVFFKLLQFASMDVLKDGKLNYLKLEINTVMMGTITFLGFISADISLSESADNPFSVTYPVTFNVFSTEPTMASFAQIMSAMKTATTADTTAATTATNPATGTATATTAKASTGTTTATATDVVTRTPVASNKTASTPNTAFVPTVSTPKTGTDQSAAIAKLLNDSNAGVTKAAALEEQMKHSGLEELLKTGHL
ncbi:hypothetical protein [Ewingella americana]|uniref:Uncharacterized protein n=1 Tax=Ewingella americana TaxID=41202 RepID=A0A502GF24_9GAMM|nr:hypothetical protein [Ewingella americana]TPG60138.1 hypothetical protein EAH77_16345 [Ewingella americana]